MTNLPVHPYTKLTAIGFRRDGSPIWPIMGGSEPAAPATPTPAAPAGATPPNPAPTNDPKPAEPAAGDPPNGKPADTPDEPLGEGGKKALQAERKAREELERQVKALAPLAKLAEALGADPSKAGKDGPEQLAEQFEALKKQVTDEQLARFRAEVAHEKGLTAKQAARLVGATREELTADADELLATFPAAPATPGTPRPDPSQGARGGGEVDNEALIAEAQKKGDWHTVLRLQNEKLARMATKTQ